MSSPLGAASNKRKHAARQLQDDVLDRYVKCHGSKAHKNAWELYRLQQAEGYGVESLMESLLDKIANMSKVTTNYFFLHEASSTSAQKSAPAMNRDNEYAEIDDDNTSNLWDDHDDDTDVDESPAPGKRYHTSIRSGSQPAAGQSFRRSAKPRSGPGSGEARPGGYRTKAFIEEENAQLAALNLSSLSDVEAFVPKFLISVNEPSTNPVEWLMKRHKNRPLDALFWKFVQAELASDSDWQDEV